MPTPPQGDAEQMTASVMDKLRSAVALLQAKAPDQVEPFRSVVLEACDAVANASKGVDPAEATVIDQVRTALAGAPATGDEPPVVGT